MSTRFALSAIGQDRPGIVAAITDVLYQHGCNIEDSAMTILQGQFAMILVVTPPDSLRQEELRAQLDMASLAQKMQLTITPLKEEAQDTAQGTARQAYRVSVYGADHPGIVSRTTAFLAQREINICDLSTRVIEGAGPVYIMVLEVEAPAQLEESRLRSDLQQLGKELQVDLSLQRVETEMI